MKIIYEPEVYLVGRQQIDWEELDKMITSLGLEWVAPNDEVLPSDGELLPEAAGRLCYLSYGKGRKTNREYLENILQQSHGSVLEHTVWNFVIKGVSRSWSHEVIRHRHFSFSQLSQRYVDESETAFVMPPAVQALDRDAKDLWGKQMNHALWAYNQLVERLMSTGLKRKQAREAARSVLPNATETMIFITANVRALRNFIELRGSQHADAEMRRVALKILDTMQQEAPNLFRDYKLQQFSDNPQDEEASTEYRKV